VKVVSLEADGGHLRVRDGDALGIAAPIDLRANVEPGSAVRRGNQADTAGSVLARILATEESRMSWQLLYGADTRMYFFNIVPIPAP
jgi:hypothetical protein